MADSNREELIPRLSYRSLETEASAQLPIDELGRSRFAENLVELLTSANLKPPYVFGLYGRWGAGKTWVAKQMETRLRWEQHKYSTCWFEAWRYESEENLMLPLCGAIESQFNIKVRNIDATSRAQFEWLLKEGRSRILAGLPKAFASLLGALVQSTPTWLIGTLGAALIVGRFLPSTSPVTRVVADVISLLILLGLIWLSFRLRRSHLEAWTDSVNEARAFFKSFIEEALKEKGVKRPLFIFVEDLDRCAPDSALKLIESIKRIALNSVADLPVVFVLILDRDALVAAVQHRYGRGYGTSWAEDYLQKLIRYSVDLPEVGTQGMTQFFMNRNTEFRFGFEQKHLDQLAKMCVSGRLHNVRKLELVLQRFHVIDSIYGAKNPKYKDFRFKVLFYLLLKEFQPNIHARIMSDNSLLPKFVDAAKESVNGWVKNFSGNELTLPDAKDRDLGGLFHQFAVAERIEDEGQANRIIRYALMIEGVGVQD